MATPGRWGGEVTRGPYYESAQFARRRAAGSVVVAACRRDASGSTREGAADRGDTHEPRGNQLEPCLATRFAWVAIPPLRPAARASSLVNS